MLLEEVVVMRLSDEVVVKHWCKWPGEWDWEEIWNVQKSSKKRVSGFLVERVLILGMVRMVVLLVSRDGENESVVGGVS